ncbi:MAG: pantoate--beta-alanine ligase [Nocardioidaceae bacterium]
MTARSTTSPTIASTRLDLQAALTRRIAASNIERGPRVAFVPTMGALHAGHVALFDEARAVAQVVVASLFVNPLQFAAEADLSRYPRALAADLEVCAASGVDVVFAPGVEVMYPSGRPCVTIDPGPLATLLEGASRPDHFAGVLTVVTKLFGLIQPDIALFGEKDFQQLVLIRQLVSDLDMPLQVLGVETVREPDGLAVSSRNCFLGALERRSAVALSRALVAGRLASPSGAEAILGGARVVLAGEPEVDVDYLELRAPNLGPPPAVGPARLLVAARVGATRLIDNIVVHVGRGSA